MLTGSQLGIAYFCHPVDDTPLVPVPSELVAQKRNGEKKHETEKESLLTAAQHLESRLAATYGWEKTDSLASIQEIVTTE